MAIVGPSASVLSPHWTAAHCCHRAIIVSADSVRICMQTVIQSAGGVRMEAYVQCHKTHEFRLNLHSSLSHGSRWTPPPVPCLLVPRFRGLSFDLLSLSSLGNSPTLYRRTASNGQLLLDECRCQCHNHSHVDYFILLMDLDLDLHFLPSSSQLHRCCRCNLSFQL